MESIKTGMGVCTFSNDSIHLDEHLFIFWKRFVAYNKWWIGLGLFALGLIAFVFVATAPLTLSRLLQFLELLGWIVLVSVGLAVIIVALLFVSSRNRPPTNLINRMRTDIEIPLGSITRVTVQNLVGTRILYVHYQDSGSTSTLAIRFLRGMEEEFASAKEQLEQRGFSIEK